MQRRAIGLPLAREQRRESPAAALFSHSSHQHGACALAASLRCCTSMTRTRGRARPQQDVQHPPSQCPAPALFTTYIIISCRRFLAARCRERLLLLATARLWPPCFFLFPRPWVAECSAEDDLQRHVHPVPALPAPGGQQEGLREGRAQQGQEQHRAGHRLQRSQRVRRHAAGTLCLSARAIARGPPTAMEGGPAAAVPSQGIADGSPFQLPTVEQEASPRPLTSGRKRH
jgi:hypothetical protein